MELPDGSGPSMGCGFQYNVSTENNYSSLSDNDTDYSEHIRNKNLKKKRKPQSAEDTTQEPKKNFTELNKITSVQVNRYSFKVPPIKAYGANVKELTNALKVQLKSRYCIQNVNKNLSLVYTDSIDDYNKCIELLDAAKTHHFSHTPTELKPINVLLKNIHTSYTDEDVNDALKQLKFSDPNTNITKVSKYSTLRSKREGRELSIYRVQLCPLSQIKEITDIKYLLNQAVTWEKIHTSDMMQCYRCQRYNHSARNCKMPYRCVKCKSDHLPGECPVNPIKEKIMKENAAIDDASKNRAEGDETPHKPLQPLPEPSCVNCGQVGHPANYRKCPKYQMILQQRESRVLKAAEEEQQQKNMKAKLYQNFVQPTTSYASATQGNMDNKKSHLLSLDPVSQQNNSAFNFMSSECNKLFGADIFEILTKIQVFIPFYKKLNDKNVQQKELFKFMFELINIP